MRRGCPHGLILRRAASCSNHKLSCCWRTPGVALDPETAMGTQLFELCAGNIAVCWNHMTWPLHSINTHPDGLQKSHMPCNVRVYIRVWVLRGIPHSCLQK
jgi:hypothetical protein